MPLGDSQRARFQASAHRSARPEASSAATPRSAIVAAAISARDRRPRYTPTVARHTAAALLASIAIAAAPSRALAAPATLSAIAPNTNDARKAVPIGPHGEVYEPDGKGAWIRKKAGGTTVELTAATAIGGTVIASGKNAPPFKLTKAGTWSSVFLIPKAKAVVGVGSRVLAAVGKQVFALDTTAAQAVKIGDAPSRISALAASKTRAIAVTDKGLVELPAKGSAWKPIKKAPKSVRALVSDRWALVDRGVLDLKTLKTIAWPAGLRVDDATTVGETLYAVAAHGKQRELLVLTPAAAATKAPKFDRETIPLDGGGNVIGVVADDDKRVLVATRDGKLALREKGMWTTTDVRDELPADKAPGPAPALSAGTP